MIFLTFCKEVLLLRTVAKSSSCLLINRKISNFPYLKIQIFKPWKYKNVASLDVEEFLDLFYKMSAFSAQEQKHHCLTQEVVPFKLFYAWRVIYVILFQKKGQSKTFLSLKIYRTLVVGAVLNASACMSCIPVSSKTTVTLPPLKEFIRCPNRGPYLSDKTVSAACPEQGFTHRSTVSSADK